MGRGAAAGLVLVMLLAGCGDDAAEEAPVASDAELPAEGGAVADPDGSVEVTIADFRFSPDTITIPAGGSLVVEVTNEDDVAHTFTAADLGLDVAVDPGGQGMAAASSPAPGSYEWICRVHPSMTGTLVVEGSG